MLRATGKKILMAGPSLQGHGGITRVVNNWLAADFFAGYELEYLATTAENGKRMMPALAALFKLAMLAAQCDLIYIHSSSWNSFFRKSLFARAGRFHKSKVVLHIHPNHFLDFIEQSRGARRRYILGTLAACDSFVVLNEEMARALIALFPHKPVSVLPNPVDVTFIEAYPAGERETANLLYLGNYLPAKGIFDLVEAVALLQRKGVPVTVKCFGGGDVGAFASYVSQRGLSERITVSGWLARQEVIRELKSCTALVLPSHSEGMPNVILEAMAAHTPVISTKVGGLKELLRNGENAFVVDAKEPVDLAAKIESCLQDYCLRQRVAEKGYAEVSARFDAAVLRDCFHSILRKTMLS